MKSKRSKKDKARRKGLKKNGLILRALFDEKVRQFQINAMKVRQSQENAISI